MPDGTAPTGAAPSARRNSDAPSHQRVIELVESRRQESERYNSGVFSKLQGWYNIYRGVWQGRLAQFRNNVSIPLTFAMIQSDVARKVQTSFGAWPIVTFEGYSPEDSPRAKKNEVLVSAQMKDADSVMQAVDFFLQADICGTAIARYGWKNITRRNRIRRMEPIAPGLSVPVVREYDAEIFNGPIWSPVDRLDFFQEPGKKRIDDMRWVCHRYWLDLDDMLEDAAGPHPYFDPAAVRALQSFPIEGPAYQEFYARKLQYRNEFDYMARQRQRFSRPVEIVEMHGLVPREFATDGIRSRCVAVGNGRVVLKNRELPMWDQQKQFIAYSPMPDPYSFDAPGKAEIAEKLQRTVDRLTNQKLDALDLVIDPMWVTSDQANLTQQPIYSRAGRILTVSGGADDSNIRPLSPDLRGFNAAFTEIAQLWQFMQVGAGINDIVMGLQAGQRETARGFLGRQENVLTRLSLEARLAEEGFIEPLANAFRKLDRQFLSLPHEVKILGSLATVNPITGLRYPDEPVTVDVDDLAPDYRARAVGASQMIGRGIRQQNAVGLLQIMSSNPAFIALVNWTNYARQLFELFDFKNVDELLNLGEIPLVNQLAMQSGRSPAEVGAAASQSLGELSPEILSQFAGQNRAALPALAGV